MTTSIKRHSIRCWYAHKKCKERCERCCNNRVDSEAPVVVVLGHVRVVFKRWLEHKQKLGLDGICVCFETGKDHPEDRKEEDQRDDPGKNGPENVSKPGFLSDCSHVSVLIHHALTNHAKQKYRNDVGNDYGEYAGGAGCTNVIR